MFSLSSIDVDGLRSNSFNLGSYIFKNRVINLFDAPSSSSPIPFENGFQLLNSSKYDSGSVVDILSMVSFDNSTLYATAIKNLI
jgi:hypothetical protein